MSSREVLNLISMSNSYNRRPSEFFGIEDTYTAYCLDEACSFILTKIQNGEEPRFTKKFTSFKDIYRQFGV